MPEWCVEDCVELPAPALMGRIKAFEDDGTIALVYARYRNARKQRVYKEFRVLVRDLHKATP